MIMDDFHFQFVFAGVIERMEAAALRHETSIEVALADNDRGAKDQLFQKMKESNWEIKEIAATKNYIVLEIAWEKNNDDVI